MLNKLLSKNNSAIFTWDKKYLCSRSNPQKEAEEWVNLNADQVNSANSVVVLGLGCGYHILSLQQKFPNKKIKVVETQKSIIDFFSQNFPIEESKLSVLWIQNENQLLANPEIKNLVKEFFVILTYQPLFRVFPEYSVFEKWLTGRNFESFQWLINVRSLSEEFHTSNLGLKDLNQQALMLLDTQKALNIKGSTKSIEIHHKMEALRELIV